MLEPLRARIEHTGVRLIGPSEVHANLPYGELIEALRAMFRAGAEMPPPIDCTLPTGNDDAPAKLEAAIAWQGGRYAGVRAATFFPPTEKHPAHASAGAFLLFGARSGMLAAVIDAPALRLRRAAAAAALAASYLARPDAERLLIVGTGPLAGQLLEAHVRVRPIRNVLVWGRDPEKAARLAYRHDRRGLKVTATTDLAGAVRGAHVVSCATRAETPLILGEWLPQGVHLDLAGGITAEMREADDDCISRARVFVDDRDLALAAGDLAQPIAAGRMTPDDIAGDLRELTRGSRAGRRFYDQITLFKSVGVVLEDLAAAILVLDTIRS